MEDNTKKKARTRKRLHEREEVKMRQFLPSFSLHHRKEISSSTPYECLFNTTVAGIIIAFSSYMSHH
jgi:hypothetical protein